MPRRAKVTEVTKLQLIEKCEDLIIGLDGIMFNYHGSDAETESLISRVEDLIHLLEHCPKGDLTEHS